MVRLGVYVWSLGVLNVSEALGGLRDTSFQCGHLVWHQWCMLYGLTPL